MLASTLFQNFSTELTKRRSASDPIRTDKESSTQWQRLEDQTSLHQLMLSRLNLFQPLLPPSPTRRPQRDLIPSPPEMHESHCEPLLVVFVDAGRRLSEEFGG